MVLGTLLLSACDTVTISSTPTVPPTPGTLRWKVQTHASTGDYVGPPVVANGLLYVGLTGEVLAIDASSGTQRWQFPVRGGAGGLAAANGLLYFSSGRTDQDATMYALDANTGFPRWQVPGCCTSVEADGVLYVAGLDVMALDAGTGAQRWLFRPPYGTVHGTPVVANGMVYVGAVGSPHAWAIYALDASTGAQRWWFSMSGDTVFTPAVGNGMVYIGTADGRTRRTLYALDATTGVQRWRIQTDMQGDYTTPLDDTPAVANGLVYVGTELGIMALDASTGARRWELGNDDPISFPVAANDVVYGVSGKLYPQPNSVIALDAHTGGQRWKFPVGALAIPTPVVANGMVYFSSAEASYKGAYYSFEEVIYALTV